MTRGENVWCFSLDLTYNKYLLSNGLELDYYAEDTMSMIENDIDSLFRTGGTTMLKNDITGLEDFELIDFMEYANKEFNKIKTGSWWATGFSGERNPLLVLHQLI